MTPDEFRAWKRRLGLSDRAAADVLGVSIHAVRSWAISESSRHHRPVPGPVKKLCAMLEAQAVPRPASPPLD